jgi:hypothetical protein
LTLGDTVAFAHTLTSRKPRTAAEHYDEWFNTLPDSERSIVADALHDRAHTNAELKNILETDEDHPAPRYGMTAFREWRATK